MHRKEEGRVLDPGLANNKNETIGNGKGVHNI